MSTRIIILTHEFFPTKGGISTYVRETAHAAQLSGWEVQVWAPDHPDLREAAFDFTIVPLPLKGTQDWADRIRLRKAIRNADLDWSNTILYLPEPGPQRLWIYGQSIELPQPAKTVLTLHGSEINLFHRRAHRRSRFQYLLNHSDRVGVVSNAIEQSLKSKFELSDSKLVCVPGALPANFQLNSVHIQKPAPDFFQILTVARIHPRKGQLELLESIAALPLELRRKISYRLVGPVVKPDYLKRLKAYAHKKHIHLIGPDLLTDEQLPQAYADCDLFALTSVEKGASTEGFGLCYLEAAALGKPILAHNTGGAAEAVPHNKIGLVVPSNSHQALTLALKQLIESPELRKRFSDAGPHWAQRFSWKKNAEQLFTELP